VVGGHPTQGSLGGLLHRCFLVLLGGPLWGSRDGHYGQGSSIFFSNMGLLLQAGGPAPRDDYGLPPPGQCLVERAHRQLKAAFRARGAGTDWPAHLPWVLLGLHAAPKEISGVSSAEAVYGEQLTLPGDFNAGVEFPPLAFKEELASSQPPPTCQP
jgi:hypothetical protein